MRIDFTIGELEQHQMELSFDQTSGDLRILMDGTQVLQDSPVLTTEPIKCYELSVGECEKHTLAFRLTYGNEPDDTELQAMTKLRLMVTAIT
jgi:hypothetical protein